MLPCPATLQGPPAPSYMQSATDKATAVKKTQETKKKAAPKRKSAAGTDEGEEKPKKATPKKKQGGKKGEDNNGEVLKQLQQLVNMDEDELKVSHCGGVAGLTIGTRSELGIPAYMSWKLESKADPAPAVSSMSTWGEAKPQVSISRCAAPEIQL